MRPKTRILNEKETKQMKTAHPVSADDRMVLTRARCSWSGSDQHVIEIPNHGRILCPGFINQHVHLIGGGSEAGPTTRTPEVRLSRLTEAGVTTVTGLLGTDSVTRHPESLLAKTRALNEEGITAWMLTGA